MAQAAVGAFLHTPGPKEIYVKFASNQTFGRSGTDWQFVGTCVTAPDLSTQPKFIDVFNDYGGRSVPYQLIWDGSESRVAATVNRVDLAVCRNIRDHAEQQGTLARVGRETNLDRGSLVIGYSDFQMIIKNTYFGTGHATAGMTPGRYYFSTVLEAYEEHTTGTRVEEVSMLFRCNNVPLGINGFAQFTEDPNEFPTLTPT
jgi:hypothetical protein